MPGDLRSGPQRRHICLQALGLRLPVLQVHRLQGPGPSCPRGMAAVGCGVDFPIAAFAGRARESPPTYGFGLQGPRGPGLEGLVRLQQPAGVGHGDALLLWPGGRRLDCQKNDWRHPMGREAGVVARCGGAQAQCLKF